MIGTLNFVLRTQKKLSNGKTPIYLTYSVQGKRLFRPVNKLSIYAEYWDVETQRAFYIPQREAKKKLEHLSSNDLLTETEVNDINDAIDETASQINQIEKKFVALNKPFSSEMVVEELDSSKKPTTKTEEPNNFVFDFIDQYIKDNSATRVKGSLSVYKSLKGHLKAYEQAKKHRVTFATIDYKFFNSFQNIIAKSERPNFQNRNVLILHDK